MEQPSRHNKEQPVELQIKRSSSYEQFADKAANALILRPLPCSSIRLFGALIRAREKSTLDSWQLFVFAKKKFWLCKDWSFLHY